LFGEEPNVFLRNQAHWLRNGDSVLCVADGAGRNSVWLATQGYSVTAFDFAPNAVAKTRRSAERLAVTVDHRLGDIQTWPWTTQSYDAVVAIFIQFFPPDDRESVFAGMKSAVKPDGLFFLRVTDQNKWTMALAGHRDVNTCIHETGSSSFSGLGDTRPERVRRGNAGGTSARRHVGPHRLGRSQFLGSGIGRIATVQNELASCWR